MTKFCELSDVHWVGDLNFTPSGKCSNDLLFVGGPWGVTFDDLTGDFFVSNWGLGHHGLPPRPGACVAQIRGFPPGVNAAAVSGAIAALLGKISNITFHLNARRRMLRKEISIYNRALSICSAPACGAPVGHGKLHNAKCLGPSAMPRKPHWCRVVSCWFS